MRKFLILIAGASILGFMLYLTSCLKEEDDEYVECKITCDDANPYSNQYTSSCYATSGECETDTGHSCKDCS